MKKNPTFFENTVIQKMKKLLPNYFKENRYFISNLLHLQWISIYNGKHPHVVKKNQNKLFTANIL